MDDSMQYHWSNLKYLYVTSIAASHVSKQHEHDDVYFEYMPCYMREHMNWTHDVSYMQNFARCENVKVSH